MMKQVMLIGCLAACAAEARQLNVAQLAPSPFADTEVSTNVSCVLDHPALREYRLALGLVGTPSNNVEVALGCDADGDGRLSLDEAALTLAWDCGKWIASGRDGAAVQSLNHRMTELPNYQEAEIVVDVRRHKANPEALYDATWNLLRVTRRGVDDPQERVSVRTKNASTLILIK